MLKYSGLGAAAVASSSFLAACGGDDGGSGGGGATGPQKSGGTLIHGATGGGSKDTLDPHAPVTAADIARVNNLYEPLLFWNNNYELEPALAESVESSADAKTWTIKMRQGVTFHNGQPVTADDAWKTFNRILDEATAAAARANYLTIASIDTPDDYTVVFNLSQADVPLLAALATTNAAIVDTADIESGAVATL
ncbi:MAG TPA: peptide ABC transporter substrate-binding protein, partial [Nocardioides bacterium]|nr:peptide ABC transporter substrate-binding protein [Nocardioides sp.]